MLFDYCDLANGNYGVNALLWFYAFIMFPKNWLAVNRIASAGGLWGE